MLKRSTKLLISVLFFGASCVADAVRHLLGYRSRQSAVILYYHAVPADQRRNFARQMDTLRRWARPIEADFKSIRASGTRFAAVTFDDGFRSFAENALPELEKRKIPAALFVVAGKLGCYPDWSERVRGKTQNRELLLSADQLREMPDSIKVGSHTLTHPILTQVSEAEARRQMAGSRIQLEKILGRKVTLFSFPHGACDDERFAFSRDAGYERVFTIEPKPAFADQFVMGRVGVDPTDWYLEFLLKLLGAYRWLPLAFMLKRKISASRFHLWDSGHCTATGTQNAP